MDNDFEGSDSLSDTEATIRVVAAALDELTDELRLALARSTFRYSGRWRREIAFRSGSSCAGVDDDWISTAWELVPQLLRSSAAVEREHLKYFPYNLARLTARTLRRRNLLPNAEVLFDPTAVVYWGPPCEDDPAQLVVGADSVDRLSQALQEKGVTSSDLSALLGERSRPKGRKDRAAHYKRVQRARIRFLQSMEDVA